MFSERITRKKEEKNTKAENYYIKTKVELKEKKNHFIDFTCLTNVNYDTMTNNRVRIYEAWLSLTRCILHFFVVRW